MSDVEEGVRDIKELPLSDVARWGCLPGSVVARWGEGIGEVLDVLLCNMSYFIFQNKSFNNQQMSFFFN